MSAPMYQFRPGGFEDDEDSDEDGFYLDSISQDELAHKKFSSAPVVSSQESRGRGGFGAPKPKPADKIQLKRRSGTRQTQEPVRTLSLTDFQNAVVRGNLPTVKKMLDEGLKVDTLMPTGWTALMYSVSSANVEVTELLLDKGANPEFNKDKYTVLMAACGASGYKEEEVLKCVNILLDKRSEVNSYDRYHMSPLMYAAREGRSQVIERLVSAGANVDKQDTRGWTCLTWAVSKGHTLAVRTLLNAKADPMKKHCDGGTALDIACTDEIIKLLGGETSQDQPAVAMAAGSIRGDVNGGTGISNNTEITTGSNNSSSTSQQYGTTYGELELFLCGLDLSQFVPLFRAQHVDFSTFLRLTEEDLIKMGITQIGVRKKILDGVLAVHKKEWDRSSLTAVQYNKHVSCAESIAMVANISKHMKYITTTFGFIQDQIRTRPKIVEDLQDGTGPKQLYQHLVDTQRNVQTLYTQLDTMKLQLEQVLQKGNFESPDLLNKDKIKMTGRSSRLRIVGLVCTGAFIVTALWKRQLLIDKVCLSLSK